LKIRSRCPDGRQLITLEDAGNYITELPKAEHMAPEWQAAMEALILVASSGGPTMFVRIGVNRRGPAQEFFSNSWRAQSYFRFGQGRPAKALGAVDDTQYFATLRRSLTIASRIW